jgi:UDP-N-acetylmuramoyl-tripeptide--D-alanyl-D-alanine ligase
MKSVWDALPSEGRGGYADTAAALEPAVLAAVRAGDAVMVKGSLGSRMGPVVQALKRRHAPSGEQALAQG